VGCNKKWLESLLVDDDGLTGFVQIAFDAAMVMGVFTTRVSRLIDPVKNGRMKDAKKSTQRTDGSPSIPHFSF
jgi:hypothetical protein